MDFTALSTLSLPLAITAGALILLGLPWIVRFASFSFILLVGSVVIGQIVRFPLPGQGGGLLLSDVAVIAVLVSAALRLLHNPRLPTVAKQWVLLLLPFIAWSLASNLLNSPAYSREELLIMYAYWLRLISYLLLLPALCVLFAAHAQPKRFWFIAGSGLVCLLLLGFLQLWLFPDLNSLSDSFLEGWPASRLVLRSLGVGGSFDVGWPASRSFSEGWDPHANRLVSTWFDPNLLGAALAISLPPLVAFAVSEWHRKTVIGKALFSSIITALLTALVLTRSRSSLIALSAGLLLVSIPVVFRVVRQRKRPSIVLLGTAITSALVVIVLAIALLGARAYGLVTPDATINARLSSYVSAWQLATVHPWMGVGYNAYQFAARDAGLLADFAIHSRAGADTSFLTLAVTTGIPGVFLFMLPWLYIGHNVLRQWIKHGWGMSIAAITSVLILWLHSLMVNSLLYAHLLIVISIVVALALVSLPRTPTSSFTESSP